MQKDPEVKEKTLSLFNEWTKYVAEMRLRQEYETIKGFLIVRKLSRWENTGVKKQLPNLMNKMLYNVMFQLRMSCYKKRIF